MILKKITPLGKDSLFNGRVIDCTILPLKSVKMRLPAILYADTSTLHGLGVEIFITAVFLVIKEGTLTESKLAIALSSSMLVSRGALEK